MNPNTTRQPRQDWDVIEEVGGREVMEAMMRRFYDRLFDDLFVGFLFEGHDKERLIASQMAYIHAHLGGRQGDYKGPSIRKAHEEMTIFVGHFDRRHKVLEEVLREFDVPEEVREAWLELDRSLRELVVSSG